jgi:hypothetical protein
MGWFYQKGRAWARFGRRKNPRHITAHFPKYLKLLFIAGLLRQGARLHFNLHIPKIYVTSDVK